jgi:hypothetical protein
MSIAISTHTTTIVIDVSELQFNLEQGTYLITLHNQSKLVSEIDAFVKTGATNAELLLLAKGLIFALSDNCVDEHVRLTDNEIEHVHALFTKICPTIELNVSEFIDQFLLDGKWKYQEFKFD